MVDWQSVGEGQLCALLGGQRVASFAWRCFRCVCVTFVKYPSLFNNGVSGVYLKCRLLHLFYTALPLLPCGTQECVAAICTVFSHETPQPHSEAFLQSVYFYFLFCQWLLRLWDSSVSYACVYGQHDCVIVPEYK